MRFAPIEVWDDDFGFDDLLATTTTDANGAYSVPVPEDASDAPDLYINVLARSDEFYVVTPGDQGDPSSTYSFSTIDLQVPNVSTDIVINVSISNTTAAGNAFSVQDALIESARYTKAISGTTLPTLSVEFAGAYPTSYYSVSGGGLFILLEDRYDWDVLHHEHGHYVAESFSLDRNPGGTHRPYEHLAERVGKQDGIRLAWGEAWPTYFGITLQRERGSGALGIPNVGDLFYQDTEDATFSYSIEATGSRGRGEDNEVAVQRALWDLYDSANDDRDKVSLGDQAIWNALVTARPASMSDVWNALIANVSEEDKTKYGAIFADQGIAPDPTAPADGTVIPLNGSATPTFTWSANGAGPSFRLNRFTVAFYSEDFSTLLYETPELTTPTYTPTATELTDNIFRTEKRVKWVVKGRNVSAPATGTYISLPRLIESSGVDVAFVIDDTGSMDEEIAGVRQGLLNHLATYPNDGATTFQLVTFKDGVTSFAPTNDLATIQSQVSGLFADGGADCPEASAQAVMAAEQRLRANGRVFLATDADPHPGQDIAGTIRTLRARGVRVDVVLSGSCSGLAAREGAGANEPNTAAAPERSTDTVKPASARLALRNELVQVRAAADTLWLGDDDFAQILLPFSFPFGEATYSTAYVNSNGSVTFNSGDVSRGGSVGNLLFGPPRIAPLWDDLDPSLRGRVFVEERDGAAVITFQEVPEYNAPSPSSSPNTFALTLRPDGTFSIDYGTISAAGVFAAVHTGFSEDPGPTDLSAAPQPIDADPEGTLYEPFTGTNDLSGLLLNFDAVSSGPPPPPPVFNAIEAFSQMALQTGGIFALMPEVNSFDAQEVQRFENTVFNLVQGGINQSLALVQPGRGPRGSRFSVDIAGSGTTFRPGATRLEVEGAGVSVEEVTVLSPVRMLATLAVDEGAAEGFYNLLAVTQQGAVADSAQGLGSFIVTPPETGPKVLSVAPTVGDAGSNLTVSVFGTNTNFDETSQLQMGLGITVLSSTAISATELQASIEIAENAPMGLRDVQVVTGDEVAAENQTGPFFVTSEGQDRALLVSALPNVGAPGTETTLSVTGSNTSFVEGISALSVSGTGITTLSTTVVSPTQLSAVIQIEEDASLGARDIRVTTGTDVVALLDGFVVTDFVLAAPTLTMPDDGAADLTVAPVLVWNSIPGAVAYDVRLSTDEDFTDVAIQGTTAENAFLPLGLEGRTTYYWQARALGDGQARSEWSARRSFSTATTVANEDGEALPTAYALSPSYPNPFADETQLRFELPEQGRVMLAVYDVRGARVAVLSDQEWPAGYHAVAWRADGVPSGLYLVQLRVGSFVRTQKILLVR
ncbi:MAG: T9SS type A sorting domain-containing protein [Bacteroidota bacterium]